MNSCQSCLSSWPIHSKTKPFALDQKLVFHQTKFIIITLKDEKIWNFIIDTAEYKKRRITTRSQNKGINYNHVLELLIQLFELLRLMILSLVIDKLWDFSNIISLNWYIDIIFPNFIFIKLRIMLFLNMPSAYKLYFNYKN